MPFPALENVLLTLWRRRNALKDADSNMTPGRKVASIRRAERGQSTVEFVVVLPLLLMFFFLVVDFGWMLKNWIVVTNSAREVTRCAVAQSCTLSGAPSTPSAVATSRIDAGITNNLVAPSSCPVTLTGNVCVVVKYLDEDGDGVIRAGDSIIVCIKTANKYISPLLPMFSIVTGGSTIPNPLPLYAREQMKLELTPAGATPAADGRCGFS